MGASPAGGPTSRRLAMLFLAVVLPPAVALVWLGAQLVAQDRTMAAQRQGERRELAIAGITRALTQSLADAERWLIDDGLPEGSVRVTSTSAAAEAAVELYPAGRVLWVPRPPVVLEPASQVFEEAERAEHQDRGDKGLGRYEALARSDRPAVRAGALLRLARVHRREGRIDEALLAYVDLAAHETLAIHGMPADLLARREICRVLESAGRMSELVALRTPGSSALRGQILIFPQLSSIPDSRVRCRIVDAPSARGDSRGKIKI
jgi:hypothetical protein